MREITVRQMAAEAGFDLAGVAPATPIPDSGVYLDWVARGRAGRMGYLTDHRARIRTDPRQLLPSARSILCVGKLYRDADNAPGPIARYARSEDYHDVLRRGLEHLLAQLRSSYGEFDSKIAVDTAPLLERSYARLAGLGWIGRHTCLINQQLGSWIFLGEILTSLPLEPDSPAPDRCGTCTRCIDACPTDALIPGGLRTELDATRCISYLTIELKGEIPEKQRPAVGEHVFGCDICQEVCPWNRGSQTPAELAPLERWAAMTPEEFRAEFRRTPVWRTKYSGFLRNVAVAMGNSRDPKYRPALQSLAQTGDPVVCEHAEWALCRLEQLP